MELHSHGLPCFERLSTPPSLGQDSRGTGLEKPLPACAIRIHGLNTDLHMRIGPDELGNGRLHRRLLVRVIYQCSAVVGYSRGRYQEGADGRAERAEYAPIHGTSNRCDVGEPETAADTSLRSGVIQAGLVTIESA